MSTATQPEQTAPEQGRFDRLGLLASIVIDPRDHPLPETALRNNGIATITFAEDYGAQFQIILQERAGRHAVAAYLYALAASLNSLAREVEAQR